MSCKAIRETLGSLAVAAARSNKRLLQSRKYLVARFFGIFN